MQRVVHIAPLASLPTRASVFDYAWESDIEPKIGMVTTIPFRKSESYGIVTGVAASSRFKLKSIVVTEVAQLLEPIDLPWLEKMSQTLGINIGTLVQHALPPLSKRTIGLLSRPYSPNKSVAPGKLQYLWYSQQLSIIKALHQIVSTSKKPTGVIVPSHDDAARFAEELRALGVPVVHHFLPESAPKRRALWLDWVNKDVTPVIIGTQLPAWLPQRTGAQFILVEPTDASHSQREGTPYTHRELVESRRVMLGDNIFVLAHSPATEDLDRVTTIPTVAHWPIMVDRTTEDPKLRQAFVSPSLEQNIRGARKILFFVPHLREATHHICKDCGSLYRSEDLHDSPECKKCQGARFSKLGFGAKTVVDELRAEQILDEGEGVVMMDAEKYKSDKDVLFQETDERVIVIATAPLFDRLPLSYFDLIVDLSPDFEMIHPQYNTEEQLWHRLRAISSRLPLGWLGSWFVQTRTPNLLGWRVRDFEGFSAWWNAEKTLRKRFGQKPFSGG